MKPGWETIVMQQFPDYAWLLTDIDREKYADTFTVLQQAIDQEWYASDTGLARFAASISGTSFFRELKENNVAQQITNIVGQTGLSGNSYGRLVGQIINYGLKEDDLRFAVYREVFRRDNSGNYVNPDAIQTVKKSPIYQAYTNMANAYFVKLDDRLIERSLKGRMNFADVENRAKEIAKNRYMHLAPMIDKGMNMNEITQGYRDVAAKVLEMDPNSIDMSQAKYERAYTFDENGTKRMMTSGEWEQTLRMDKQYGWTKTTQAKDEARQLGNTLARAFGRLM